MTGQNRQGVTQGGFTLVELMFATAIAAFIIAAVMTSYVFSVKGFRRLANYNQMQEDGRRAVDWFARDLLAGMAVSSWSPNRVVVLLPSAVNSAGVVTSTNIVTHTIHSAAWYRTNGSGFTKQLATNVTSLAFSLYDQAGNVTTQASRAVSVQVEAFLTQNVQNNAQTIECLSARYRMRNTP